MAPPLLEVRAVSKVFGGLKAVNAVSLTVPDRGIHSLIGPNGAGKTTLFNVISGIYVPSAGEVLFKGTPISCQAPNRLAACGLSRTFQNLQIFSHMTAFENVMVGAHLRLNASLLAGMLRLPSVRRADAEAGQEARRLLDFVGIGEFADRLGAHMPFGALKRLEIARALMARPRLLLLDEPAAGLNQGEKVQLQALIRKVADEGITVLLVEHDMKLVMNLSDHIVVLANGSKLAEGRAEDIRTHPEVIAAYLGRPVREAKVHA
jgi:branched-chain amino acid transport system ATP-binding protein